MLTLAKFRIPLSTLPPANADGNHLFRFRIASEDRARVSEYSNLYLIKSEGQIYPQSLAGNYRVTLGKSASTITVNLLWEAPTKYNIGASANLDYTSLFPVAGINVVVSSSASNIDVSGIVPNVYLSQSLIGISTTTNTYKFFDNVTRVDALNVIQKFLSTPGVISANIDEIVRTALLKEYDVSTKWGVGNIDIFAQYFNSPSASATATFNYLGRTKESQISFIVNNYSYVRMIGQIASYEPAINSIYQFFDTGAISLVGQQVSFP